MKVGLGDTPLALRGIDKEICIINLSLFVSKDSLSL